MGRSRSRSRSRERHRRRSRDRHRRRSRSRERRRRRHRREEEEGGSPVVVSRTASTSGAGEDDCRAWDREREKKRKEKEMEQSLATVMASHRLTDKELAGKSREEIELMKVMGFSGFDSTKNKKMKGNDVGDVHVVVKRKYRQYMNRKGGFNRPLDFVH